MYIVGVGLIKPWQPWDIILIYCNNQLKKYITPFSKTSDGGTLHPSSDVYVSSFLCPFFTLIKLCYTKALEWSSLVPGPESDIVHCKLSYVCVRVYVNGRWQAALSMSGDTEAWQGRGRSTLAGITGVGIRLEPVWRGALSAGRSLTPGSLIRKTALPGRPQGQTDFHNHAQTAGALSCIPPQSM